MANWCKLEGKLMQVSHKSMQTDANWSKLMQMGGIETPHFSQSHFASFYIALTCITLPHFAPLFITSLCLTCHQVASLCCMLHHLTLIHSSSYSLTLPHFTLPHFSSHCFKWHHFPLHHPTLHHFASLCYMASLCFTWHHFVLHCITLLHNASQCITSPLCLTLHHCTLVEVGHCWHTADPSPSWSGLLNWQFDYNWSGPKPPKQLVFDGNWAGVTDLSHWLICQLYCKFKDSPGSWVKIWYIW